MIQQNNPTYIDKTNLEAEYKLDGKASDTSGNGNDGTATSITWLNNLSGKFYAKQYASFNGSSSKIDLNAKVVPTGAKSISMWIKTSSSTNTFLIDNCSNSSAFIGDAIKINQVANKVRHFVMRGSSGNYKSVTSATSVNDGAWHHVVTTDDGGTTVGNLKMYIDGVLDATGTQTGTAGTQSGVSQYDTFIGSSALSSNYFDGDMANARIFDAVLTPQEIKTLYLEGLRQFGPTNLGQYGPLFEDCVAWFEVGDGTTQLNDFIGGVVATRTAGTNTTDELGKDKALTNPNYSWSSITYTTGYTYEDSGSGRTIETSPTGLSATGVNRTTDLRHVMLFNKTLSTAEKDELTALFGTKYIYPFSKYSLPNLRENLVLEISKPAVSTTLYDSSGSGNNGTITDIDDYQLGLHTIMPFDGSTSKINFGNVGNVKSISFRIKLTTTTENIFEESSGTGVSVSGGTLSYGSWDNAYIDGEDTNTIDTEWRNVVITSSTDVSLSALQFGLITSTYGDFELSDIQVSTDELSQENAYQLFYSNY